MDASSLERITQTVLNNIAVLFAEPDFDMDQGKIRFLDRDDRCVWLGFFPTHEEQDGIIDAPTATWTIEVSHDQERV